MKKPLSARSRKMLAEGIASAKAGDIRRDPRDEVYTPERAAAFEKGMNEGFPGQLKRALGGRKMSDVAHEMEEAAERKKLAAAACEVIADQDEMSPRMTQKKLR